MNKKTGQVKHRPTRKFCFFFMHGIKTHAKKIHQTSIRNPEYHLICTNLHMAPESGWIGPRSYGLYPEKEAHSSGANIHVHLFARQTLALYSPQGSNRSLVNIPKTQQTTQQQLHAACVHRLVPETETPGKTTY